MRTVIGDNLDFYRDSARVRERGVRFCFHFPLNHRHICERKIDILRLASSSPKIPGAVSRIVACGLTITRHTARFQFPELAAASLVL